MVFLPQFLSICDLPSSILQLKVVYKNYESFPFFFKTMKTKRWQPWRFLIFSLRIACHSWRSLLIFFRRDRVVYRRYADTDGCAAELESLSSPSLVTLLGNTLLCMLLQSCLNYKFISFRLQYNNNNKKKFMISLKVKFLT